MEEHNKKRVIYLSILAISLTGTICSITYGRGYKVGLKEGCVLSNNSIYR